MKYLKLLLLFVVLFNSLFINAQNSPAPIKLVQFVLTPNHSDWNYNLKENAIVKIAVLKYGIPVNNTKVIYEFGNDEMLPDKTGKLLLKTGTAEINIGTLKTLGFRQLKVKTIIDGHTYRDQVKVGFSPFEIQATLENPKDFDAFWEQAIETNKSIPLEPVTTHKPEFSTPAVDVYLVRLQNYKKGKFIYGYLSKPKDNKKHPVLFNPPGAGVKKINAITSFAEEGFISFTTEIHGISPELSKQDYKSISNAIGDYWSINLDDKDQYYYKSVYLGCVRAIDFLTSLPEFDSKNVVVTGGSQGGALSMITAALDKRVTAVSAFYPALCDNSGYLNQRAGGWPHMFSSKYQFATPEKLNTMQYYDVVNFAKRIRIPGFYSTGYNDNTCPPTSVLSAFNSINAKKEIVITPISGHWRFPETNEKSIKWLKQTCGID
ncbi:acetylxylan esterase [Aestuariibaculum sp. M13]|uniref:acetylxylan esterase n=1 Tax=Aestuariibaculum sp. M13 TaxID=2967132 RepID=UPI002159F353|nr:acetylxylan esterase [Aestuariibaculum sp. M13]MCR8667809.1 acetylxylan esterase [Aestuariibaculum sp. M13]